MYCTPDDVRTLIPLIDQATMSDSEINKFISKASAYVDGKLQGVYQVPFDQVPDLIKDVTAELTAYFVLRTIYFQNTPNVTDATKEFKKSADDALDALASGQIQLDVPMVEDSVYVDETEQKVFTMDDIVPFNGEY